MLLKSLRMKNIRSYRECTITFPEGIVLLAGDIGAGKSTILLSIEFALFGLLRGELSGSALLRNGSHHGSVELCLEINGKEYCIGRALKRTKSSVEQDAGYIIENGRRREATATELKTAVLDMLGYPQELLARSKGLIYRYTVYTPQEEMRRIILEDAETRLEILRKVFGIDKYGRIRSNAEAYARLLRERKRRHEGELADEQLKKQQFSGCRKQEAAARQALALMQPRIDGARQKVISCRLGLEQAEKERSALLEHNAALRTAESELFSVAAQQKDLEDEKKRIAALLASAPAKPKDTPEAVAQQLRQKQEEQKNAEETLRRHIAEHAGLKAALSASRAAGKKIAEMNQCPLCRQQVTHEHKSRITREEQEQAGAISGQLAAAEKAMSSQEQQRQKISGETVALQQQYVAAREAQLRHSQAELHRQRMQQIETRLAALAQLRTGAEQAKKQAAQKLGRAGETEQAFQEAKQALDRETANEQAVIVEHARLSEQARSLGQTLQMLEQDLAAKKKAREQLEKLSLLHSWISNGFPSLVGTMEKQVMTKTYHEFNSLFQQWFSLLVGDEVLSARLDEAFSPIIQQAGYDIEAASLSGGERTACALAYRLALNRVISALRSGIRTEGLIILDEPTDGFSASQLARMRDVLEQAKARQIVLVSHEQEIESMADRIIRVAKEGNASRIIV